MFVIDSTNLSLPCGRACKVRVIKETNIQLFGTPPLGVSRVSETLVSLGRVARGLTGSTSGGPERFIKGTDSSQLTERDEAAVQHRQLDLTGNGSETPSRI